MFTRIVWVKIAEGRWDQFLAKYLEHVDGRADIEVGMVQRTIVREHDDPDVGLLITTWETAEDLARYAAHPVHAEFGEVLGEGVMEAYWVKHGDVVHSRLS